MKKEEGFVEVRHYNLGTLVTEHQYPHLLREEWFRTIIISSRVTLNHTRALDMIIIQSSNTKILEIMQGHCLCHRHNPLRLHMCAQVGLLLGHLCPEGREQSVLRQEGWLSTQFAFHPQYLSDQFSGFSFSVFKNISNFYNFFKYPFQIVFSLIFFCFLCFLILCF